MIFKKKKCNTFFFLQFSFAPRLAFLQKLENKKSHNFFVSRKIQKAVYFLILKNNNIFFLIFFFLVTRAFGKIQQFR